MHGCLPELPPRVRDAADVGASFCGNQTVSFRRPKLKKNVDFSTSSGRVLDAWRLEIVSRRRARVAPW